MKFTRNKNQTKPSGNLSQQINIFVYGSVFILLLILYHLHDHDLSPVPVNGEGVKRTVREMKQWERRDVEAKQHGNGVDVNGTNGGSAITSQSLLNSPQAIKNLPPCHATHHDIAAPQLNTSQIALFSSWDVSAIHKWNRIKFQYTFGNYMQYVKGRDVQPLKDKHGDMCKVSTRTLIDAMSKLDREKDEMDLLFFTNDKENPDFIKNLSGDYSIPAALGEMETFTNGFRVFSAMEQGSSHPFHFHDAAWLGQVSGSRLWFFLPPDTPRRVVGKKVNGCDYLLGHSPLPKGVSSCIQQKGEVMYLPPKWLHATCALEPWSVGVGGQGGDPSVYHQKFDNLERKAAIDSVAEQQKLVDCGVSEKISI